MKNKKINIGIITSSVSVANYIHRIRTELDQHIDISTKGLEEAVPIGRQMQKNGADVIISRKGAAHLLRENLTIPVLSVPHSSLEIITCLKEAARLGQKIFLPSFREKLSGMEIMEQLLDIQLVQGTYDDMATLEEAVCESKKQGCQVVVGGGLAMRYARKYGLETLEIKTAREGIDTTLESAISVARSHRQEQAQTQQYRSIVDSVSDGIISVDQEGVIGTINKSARNYLNISDPDVIGADIHRFLPGAPVAKVLASKHPTLDQLQRIDKELFIFNYTPVLLEAEAVGCIVTIQAASRLIRTESEVRRSLTRGLVARYGLKDLIHECPAMQKLVTISKQFAATDSTVLVSGETGTGKEIVSQSIHNLSRRRRGPFVSINCAALPEQLLESELFGYQEGAFTGSRKGGKAGLFEMAHKGTILLDEISATPENVQIRLLRILQEREVMRVGGNRLIPIDVRVIANSNRDLGAEVRNGNFREDLFFRLNVLQVKIPPLRHRLQDISLLATDFIHRISRQHGLGPIVIPPTCFRRLVDYSWPGNVRQLRNFIEQVVLLCNSRFKMDIFEELYATLIQYRPMQSYRPDGGDHPPLKPPAGSAPPAEGERDQFEVMKSRLERRARENEAQLIRLALQEAHYNKGRTAEILGISRATLWKKIKTLKIQ